MRSTMRYATLALTISLALATTATAQRWQRKGVTPVARYAHPHQYKDARRAAQMRINRARVQLRDVELRHRGVRKRIAAVENEHAGVKDRIAGLAAERGDARAERNAITRPLPVLADRRADLEARLSATEERIRRMERGIRAVRGRSCVATPARGNLRAALQRERRNAQGLRRAVSVICRRMSDIDARAASLDDRMRAIDCELTTLRTRCARLEAKAAKLKRACAEFTQRREALLAEIADAEAEIDSLRARRRGHRRF